MASTPTLQPEPSHPSQLVRQNAFIWERLVQAGTARDAEDDAALAQSPDIPAPEAAPAANAGLEDTATEAAVIGLHPESDSNGL